MNRARPGRQRDLGPLWRHGGTIALGFGTCLLSVPLWRHANPAGEWALLGGACLVGFAAGFGLRSGFGVVSWVFIALIVASLGLGGDWRDFDAGVGIVESALLSMLFGLAGVFVAWRRSSRKP